MGNVAPRAAGIFSIRSGGGKKCPPPLRSGYRTITTTGYLRNPEKAWVYVGVAKSGRVKIGMSGDPEARCRRLGISLWSTQEVVPSAAKIVETESLRLLRREQADGEWGSFTPDAAVSAVKKAFRAVCLERWTDPTMTEAEARNWRIAQARIAA